MISLRIRNRKSGRFRMIFTCSSCGASQRLLSMMPRICSSTGCNERIPNLFALLYSTKERKKWHKATNEGAQNADMSIL